MNKHACSLPQNITAITSLVCYSSTVFDWYEKSATKERGNSVKTRSSTGTIFFSPKSSLLGGRFFTTHTLHILFIILFTSYLPFYQYRFLESDIKFITKTYLYNFDPLKPHFYIVKLGFTGVYIIFLISAQKHRLWVLVRTASARRF